MTVGHFLLTQVFSNLNQIAIVYKRPILWANPRKDGDFQWLCCSIALKGRSCGCAWTQWSWMPETPPCSVVSAPDDECRGNADSRRFAMFTQYLQHHTHVTGASEVGGVTPEVVEASEASKSYLYTLHACMLYVVVVIIGLATNLHSCS